MFLEEYLQRAEQSREGAAILYLADVLTYLLDEDKLVDILARAIVKAATLPAAPTPPGVLPVPAPFQKDQNPAA